MSFDERLRSPATDRLFEAMLLLESVEEFYQLFEDLCTIGEIETLAARFRAAEMLHRGGTYEEIVRETGMSSATISRIKRFLRYGADGYLLALERLQAADEESEEESPGGYPST